MNILGVSAFYHDSSACLVQDGKIVSAVQEERFTRKKHDPAFPTNAIKFCLDSNGLKISDIDFIAFYDKPLLKYERLLETYLTVAPRGLFSYLQAMPIWVKEKLWIPEIIKRETGFKGEILFTEHHQSHAASAFYPSPYEEAAILTIDGVGEWTTNSLGVGRGNKFNIFKEINFPHSIGLLYSAITYFTGFKVNSGEYKVMGLAPYGNPKYAQKIYDHLIDLKADGSYQLNLEYFNYLSGLTMTNSKIDKIFDGPRRKPESKLTQREMDLAASIQVVVEECLFRQAKFLKNETGLENLCMAGGVALNCVANGKLLKKEIFKNIWIQPAAGDAGGALGAALSVWYGYLDNKRIVENKSDSQFGSLLGPSFTNDEIDEDLREFNAKYQVISDQELYQKISNELIAEKVIGWFQGKMEFGPRALGNRSIIGDARSPKMQSKMNLKIKYRESFRPFAPIVLREDVNKYFDLDYDSPYMLLVANVNDSRRIKMTDDDQQKFGIDKLNVVRSDIPAVTHIDYSARIQTVSKEHNERLYNLISEFKKQTQYSVLVNTSFNVRGEPIVCTPRDAYRCFMRTEMDLLVIGNYVFYKEEQPKFDEKSNWQNEFQLD
jgi:carbamoyltransferase